MWGGEGVTFCANISTKWIATSIRFLREKEKLRETGSFGAQPPEEKDRQTDRSAAAATTAAVALDFCIEQPKAK